jgi:hypothetical protein
LANVWRNTSGTPVKGCPVMMRVSDKTIITITEIKKISSRLHAMAQVPIEPVGVVDKKEAAEAASCKVVSQID